MEAIQWVYQKCIALGLPATTGRMDNAPTDKIGIYETDHSPLDTKDGPYAELPTITVIVIKKTKLEAMEVYNTLRSGLTRDPANNIGMVKFLDRQYYAHEKTELYRLDIPLKIKQNV